MLPHFWIKIARVSSHRPQNIVKHHYRDISHTIEIA
jgi:hypothetical protein